MSMNSKFEVRVLTKREAVRTRIVSAPSAQVARKHAELSMRKSDERVLNVRPV